VTRILLVEDEIALSDPLSFLLEREGYEVEVAADGPSAIEAFDRSGADLVLLDLMLPGLPGTEVCREIRTRSTVPIIMRHREGLRDRHRGGPRARRRRLRDEAVLHA
jgi:two-component system response regulator RegX3